MSDRFVMPIQSAFNNDGTSLPGAKLNFYITSTTTRKNTFSDSALSSANANPVVADSSGRFGDIFISSDVAYKVVLTDADDNAFWTADPYTTPVSLAWTELTTTAMRTTNLTGANQVRTTGFATSGDEGGGMWLSTGNSGSAGTTSFATGLLYDSAGNEFKIDAGGVVDPRQFGAVGDGSTVAQDVLINNAIDFLADETIAGGTVSIGPGDYVVDNALVPRAGVNIIGAGVGATQLVMSGTNDSVHAIDAGNSDNTNIEIAGMEIDAALSTTAGHAIRFADGAQDIRIHDIYAHDTQGYGFGFQGASTGFKRIWIYDCFIENAGRDGIDIKDPAGDNEQIFIRNIAIDGVGQQTDSQAGIDIRGIASISNIQVKGLDSASPSADTGIRCRSAVGNIANGSTGRKTTITGFSIEGTGALTRGLNLSGRRCIASKGIVELSGATSRGCIVDTPAGTQVTFDPGDVAANVVTVVDHGYIDNHGPVIVTKGTSLDTGLTANTPYWIDLLTSDTFSFLVASGGATVTLNGDGVGTTTISEAANENAIKDVKFVGANIGISLADTSMRTTVSDCEIVESSIGISESGTESDLSNNRIGQQTASGITVTATSANCDISDNGFYDNTTYGIVMTAGATGCRIIQNRFRGNGSGEVLNSAATDAIFQGNHGITTPTLAPAATVLVPPSSGQILVSASGTSIDIITPTFDGDEISLIFIGISTVADASTNSGNVQMKGGADFVSSANDTLTLKYELSTDSWYDFGQSVN